jgi:hypothetical protein
VGLDHRFVAIKTHPFPGAKVALLFLAKINSKKLAKTHPDRLLYI